MNYVLVTVSKGKISDVKFYATAPPAIKELLTLSDLINNECDDAAVFGPDGMLLNTQQLKYPGEKIFIIANPNHSLGFLVIAHNEPVGYSNPFEVLHVLQKVRQEMGNHIGLYQVVPVKDLIVNRSEMLDYLNKNQIQNLDLSIITEFVKPDC